MSNLQIAIILATKAHKGQVDKGGNPYIGHPLRIMSKFKDTDSRIIAVLHDVVEDTDVTFGTLVDLGFSKVIFDAVDALTRRKNETYNQFILRCMRNEKAKDVKVQDILDNMDLKRISNPTKQDYIRITRYTKAFEILTCTTYEKYMKTELI